MDCEGGIVSIDCHIIIPAPHTHLATQKASIMMCIFCCLNAINQTENKLSNLVVCYFGGGAGILQIVAQMAMSWQVGYIAI